MTKQILFWARISDMGSFVLRHDALVPAHGNDGNVKCQGCVANLLSTCYAIESNRHASNTATQASGTHGTHVPRTYALTRRLRR